MWARERGASLMMLDASAANRALLSTSNFTAIAAAAC